MPCPSWWNEVIRVFEIRTDVEIYMVSVRWNFRAESKKTYLEAKLAGKSMAKAGDGSSLVTSFCISFALLRRMEARSLEKEPLRRVRPTHFYLRVHFAQDEGIVSRRWKIGRYRGGFLFGRKTSASHTKRKYKGTSSKISISKKRKIHTRKMSAIKLRNFK